MVTVLAVIVPLDEEPLTVAQSPATAEEDGTEATWEKVVEGVQLTVTCPVCWFWTSMDEPVTAATEPEVGGENEPPLGVVAAPATPAKARLAARVTPTVATSTDRRQRVCGHFMVCCSPSFPKRADGISEST
jgi:hypothetical protein